MLHKVDEFPGQMTFFISFETIIMQKYALFIFFLRNIMGFLRPKYFFSENLIFSLSNKV